MILFGPVRGFNTQVIVAAKIDVIVWRVRIFIDIDVKFVCRQIGVSHYARFHHLFKRHRLFRF